MIWDLSITKNVEFGNSLLYEKRQLYFSNDVIIKCVCVSFLELIRHHYLNQVSQNSKKFEFYGFPGIAIQNGIFPTFI